jgi:hypothetical protein
MSAVKRELADVRAKSLASLEKLNLSNLRLCVLTSGLAPGPQATAADIEVLINAGISNLQPAAHREAVEYLFGTQPDLRAAHLTDRRRKAARHLNITQESFRKYREKTLLGQLATAILNLSEANIESTQSAENRESRLKDHELEYDAVGDSRTPRASLRRRVETIAHRIDASPLTKITVSLCVIVGGVAAVIAIIPSDKTDPPKGTSPPLVNAQPYGGGPLPPPNTGATNELYVAGDRFVDKEFDQHIGPAYCGKSPTSARPDASLCVAVFARNPANPSQVGMMKFDPCFSVDSESVICAGYSKDPSEYFRFRRSSASISTNSTVPNGSRIWPWRVVTQDGTICQSLSGVIVQEGDSLVMTLNQPNTLESTQSPTYICGHRVSPTIAPEWSLGPHDVLERVRWLEPPDEYHDAQLGGLEVSDGIWTAMYSDKKNTEYKRTRLDTVVF